MIERDAIWTYRAAGLKEWDRCLVRDLDQGWWRPALFAYLSQEHGSGFQDAWVHEGGIIPVKCLQCIPFDGYESFIGKTASPFNCDKFNRNQLVACRNDADEKWTIATWKGWNPVKRVHEVALEKTPFLHESIHEFKTCIEWNMDGFSRGRKHDA